MSGTIDCRLYFLFTTLLLYCSFAAANPLSVANELRTSQCGSPPAVLPPLQWDEQAARIARAWSGGGTLRDHIADAGPMRFVGLHVRGAPSDAVLRSALQEQLCTELAQPEFARLGSHRERDGVWLVLSSAGAGPADSQLPQVRAQVLALVNHARAQARRCGTKRLKPVEPLSADPQLDRVARQHAINMARNQVLQHRGVDGSTPAQRVSASGYKWRTVGENIAAGPTTAAEVVAGWLTSPGHCANIMSPDFRQMGLAYAQNEGRDSGVYWAQVLATPE